MLFILPCAVWRVITRLVVGKGEWDLGVQEMYLLNQGDHSVRGPMDGKDKTWDLLVQKGTVCVCSFVQAVRSLVEMRRKHGCT